MEGPPRSQLEFSAVTAQFAAAGISELPQGIAELTRKEMKFVIGVLEHGQMTRAAIDAGYSADSAASIASETLRKPKVLAFYRRCVDKVASQAEIVLRGCYQRYVIFNAKALSAAQELKDAREWLITTEVHKTGKSAADTRKYELAQDRAMREEKHYSALARAEATLILKALNRLPEGPSITVNVVPDEVRDHLAELAGAGIQVALPEPTGSRN